MKQIKLLALLLTNSFIFSNAIAQFNASLSVTGGTVAIGSTGDIEVRVSNTNPTNTIVANKIRTQISFPAAIAMPSATALQSGLPAGWVVTTNTAAGVITFCNGTDAIPPSTTRIILVKYNGNVLGGPSTVSGQLSFGNGSTANCGGIGTLAGDAGADNSSSSSITVTVTTPLTLLDFNASYNNCTPTLKWSTTNEVNTSKFEIERNTISNINGWTKIGETASQINSSQQNNYSFIDIFTNNNETKYLYRLKMIDLNGEYKYSPIIIVNNNCKKAKVEIYPNPITNGNLNVTINGYSKKAIGILKSNLGAIVFSKNVVNGTNVLNIAGTPNGVYILSVVDDKGNINHNKVIIQNQ